MREIRTSGLMSGEGKRSVAAWPKPPRPSSTLLKAQKNDDLDAEAIAEAATRPTMRFVEVKGQAQSDIQALHRARERYQRCGAALVAFAISNSFVARRLYRFPLKGFRFYAHNAGSSLLSLSESTPGTQASDYLREQTVSALKLSYWPPGRKRRHWWKWW
jgi:hypothetical protein